mmetsp:Transcript_34760/g.55907  ORF Transcript_34760/g.55907 Transcript_34760/m.55907 type:complete len:95 (-) Transcript_34760:192-476(-)
MRTDLDAIQNQNIGSELVYIDSNVERLVEYAEDTSLSQLLLCFATWGPSTPSMRSKVYQVPQINVLESAFLPSFLDGDPFPSLPAKPSEIIYNS